MTDPRSLLEREMRRVQLRPFTFEGFHSRRDRKRRNQRIAAGVVGITVFVAAVVAIRVAATGGPSDGNREPVSGPTIAPDVPVAPDVPEAVGLIGLPPEGATPSTPREGELVLSFMFGHTMGDPGRFTFHVYADGRVIWERLGDLRRSSTGLIEQRLTREGVGLVRSEVISTGLFGHDLHLASAHGLLFGEVRVSDGDRLVRVTWGDCCDPGSEDVAKEMPTPEQASALQRLDARLADPASWLPASAWEDPDMKPYVPSSYSVCYDTEQGVGLDRVLASLPQPVEGLLRSWERTHEVLAGRPGRGQPGLDIWCSRVTTEEARALAETLDDAAIGVLDSGSASIYKSRPRDRVSPDVTIGFWPVLPHDA
jgi:hypothetical protein